MRIPTVLGLAAALLLLVAHAPGQNTAPKRLALLMGVSDYSGLRLGSSPANLKVMDHALRQAGFKVTMLTDPTKDAAQEAIWRFAGKLQATPGAVAVFYFAGASVSDDTKLYLLAQSAPVEAQTAAAKGIELQPLVARLEDSGTAINIVVLDCSGPEKNDQASRAALKALHASNTFVVCAPGTKVDAGAGGSTEASPYTKALSEGLLTPGASLSSIHYRAANTVSQLGQPRPIIHTTASAYRFVFLSSETAPVATSKPFPTPTASPSTPRPTVKPFPTPTAIPSTPLPTIKPFATPTVIPSTPRPTLRPFPTPTATPSTPRPTLRPLFSPTAIPSTPRATLKPFPTPKLFPVTPDYGRPLDTANPRPLGTPVPKHTPGPEDMAAVLAGLRGHMDPDPSPNPNSTDAVDALLKGLDPGNLAFNSPEKIPVSESQIIQLVLSPQLTTGQIRGLVKAPGRIEDAPVRISAVMQADLIGDSAFDIKPLSSKEQAVSREEPTEWRWQITALKGGRHPLHLVVDAVIHTSDQQERRRTLRTFDREIMIEVGWMADLLAFLASYWLPLLAVSAALAAGGHAWWQRLRRKNSPKLTSAKMGAAIFVSYSRRDLPLVQPVVSALQAQGYTVWIDLAGIEGAEVWTAEVAQAIRDCRVVLLLATPAAMHSTHVTRELLLAQEDRKPIIPVWLRGAELPPALRLPLAGIQRIEVSRLDVAEVTPRIARALRKLNIPPPPAKARRRAGTGR